MEKATTSCGSSVCNRQPILRAQAHLVEATGSLIEGGQASHTLLCGLPRSPRIRLKGNGKQLEV